MSELSLINIQDPSILNIDDGEVKRYLKIHKLDTQNDALIKECKKEIYKAARPRCVYSRESICVGEDKVDFCFDNVESKNLSKNLCGCQEVFVFCATLGIEVDRLIQRYAKIEPSKSVVLDSVATTLIEEFCDYVNNLLGEKEKLCPRFSAGYGDYSIKHQKMILNRLDATRKIGVTLLESYMMTPAKTVSAIIGIKK